MKILKPVIRTSLTLAMVAVAAALVVVLWREYMVAPWTRDGRVGAEVVQIAPEVSGTVRDVRVVDNQFVHHGDTLYIIDPERFRLAIENAQANVEAKRQEMGLRASTASRRSRLGNGIVSAEDIEQTGGQAVIARANYQQALAALDLAKLDLERATVRSPVDGYLTNLRLRPGEYATAGATKIAVLDAASFWVTGYFEETQLARIRTGDRAEIRMMGFDPLVTGHVESLGRGIADANDSPDHLGLPSVNPVFTWVRLAQRIPVRIHIDAVPTSVQLAAGMTCSVAVGPAAEGSGPKGTLVSWLHALL